MAETSLSPDHDHEATVSTPARSDPDASSRKARRSDRRRRAARVAAAVAAVGCAAVLASTTASGGGTSTVAERGGQAGGLPVGVVVPLRVAGPLAVAPDGALYVADLASHRVLVRLPDGRFRVIAGDGRAGFSGDGGLAGRAELSTITDLAVSPTGRLYIADGGRVRVVAPDGVIRTIAAGFSWLAMAFSPHGQLYLSTGSQILRLTSDGTLVPVPAVVRTGPPVLRGDLRDFGPIAVDGHGNIDVAGFNGWSVWQVGRNGAARQVGAGSGARRSGGGYSVLERGLDGSVYAEDGPTMMRIDGRRLIPEFAFTSRVAGEYFSLTYFAMGSHGAVYADEIPGAGGFEARQQLVSLRHGRVTLLWEQPEKRIAAESGRPVAASRS